MSDDHLWKKQTNNLTWNKQTIDLNSLSLSLSLSHSQVTLGSGNDVSSSSSQSARASRPIRRLPVTSWLKKGMWYVLVVRVTRRRKEKGKEKSFFLSPLLLLPSLPSFPFLFSLPPSFFLPPSPFRSSLLSTWKKM